MNKYSAFPYRIPGGYLAMIRLCRDSHPSPVMGKGERPKIFATRGEAAEECLVRIMDFINGREIRGEFFEAPGHSQARQNADRIFIGGGKSVEIERIETRA